MDVLRPEGATANSYNPIKGLHEKLERENEDPVWSQHVEWHLRDYLNRQPGVPSKQIEIHVVECRSTLCEI